MTILVCVGQQARLPLVDEGEDNHEVSLRVIRLAVSR